MLLFDKLDIEERLDPLFIEQRQYCFIVNPEDCTDAGDDDDEDDDEGTFEAAETARRIAAFQDQCLLLDFQDVIRDYLPPRDLNNRWHDLIPIDGDPAAAISRLAHRPGAEKFFTYKPHQLSFLIPKIRLFMIQYENQNNNVLDHPASSEDGRPLPQEISSSEFLFDDYISSDIIDDIMTNHKGRAYGIGLKSFDYEFDGKDPATTRKSIKARLELVFTNFEALTKKRNGVAFLDLLLRTKRMIPRYDYNKAYTSDNILNFCRTAKEERDVYKPNSELIFNPKYRRIKASVGWAVPPASDDVIFSQDDRNLIRDLQLDIFLEMINYNLDFKNNGTVSLTIDYRGSLEGELTEPTADMFYILKDQIRDRTMRGNKKKESIKQERSNKIDDVETGVLDGDCATKKESKEAIKKQAKRELQSVDKTTKAIIEIHRLNFYRRFLEDLLAHEKVYQFYVSDDTLKQYRAVDQMAPAVGSQIKPGEIEAKNKDYASAREAANTISSWHRTTQGMLVNDLNQTLTTLMRSKRQGLTGGSGMLDPATGRPGVGHGARGTEGGMVAAIDCETSRISREAGRAMDRAREEGRESEYFGREDPQQPIVDQAEEPEDAEEIIDCESFIQSSMAQSNRRVVTFIFMGDLLDLGMYYVNFMNPNYIGLNRANQQATIAGTNSRLCTGKIDYHDFRERPKSVNIADIPVSLDQFVMFWREHVIKPGRTSYFVGDYIKDIMNDLFFRAMGDACIGGRGAPVPALSTTSITTKYRQASQCFSGGDVSKCEPIPRTTRARTGTRVLEDGPRTQGEDLRPPDLEWKYPRITSALTLRGQPISDFFTRPLDGVSSDKILHYNILHGAARNLIKRKVNKVEDEKDGIYHLGIGLDRGIVKNIKFEAADLKYATEARTIYDGQTGLGQLFAKFNATVDLFGCPMFRNGQYIFLDPKTMGVDSEVARTIGLGGYYNIFNVAGQLSPSGYVTKLRCMFNSNGVCADSEEEAAGTAHSPATLCGAPPTGGATTPTPSTATPGPVPGASPGTYSSSEEARGRASDPTFFENLPADEETDYYACLNGGATHETCAQQIRVARTMAAGIPCFVAETLISMHDGTTKAIKDIVVNDIVLSLKDGKYVEGVVTEHLIHPTNQTIEVAKLGNLIGEPTHPFYIDGQWLEMKELDNVEFEYKYIDNWYNLEIDGRDVYGSEHNYIAEGWVVSGLGDDEILNNTFQRQEIFKATRG